MGGCLNERPGTVPACPHPMIRAFATALGVLALAVGAGVVALILFVPARRWLLTIVAAVLCVVMVGVQLLRFIGPEKTDVPGVAVRVLSANPVLGEADPLAVVQSARDLADVVVLQEVTPGLAVGCWPGRDVSASGACAPIQSSWRCTSPRLRSGRLTPSPMTTCVSPTPCAPFRRLLDGGYRDAAEQGWGGGDDSQLSERLSWLPVATSGGRHRPRARAQLRRDQCWHRGSARLRPSWAGHHHRGTGRPDRKLSGLVAGWRGGPARGAVDTESLVARGSVNRVDQRAEACAVRPQRRIADV